MKIFLLFFALALAGSVSGQQYYYWVFPGEDAPNQDIQYMAGSIADLENACSSNPKCVGFNADGWLKDATNDIEPSSTTLYLKSTLPPPSVDPFLVPMPQQVTEGNTAIGVPQTLQFTTSQTSEDLANAIARYKNLIFSHPTSTRSKTYPVNLPSIKIIVENIEVPLQMGINESYTISIPADGTSGVITANTVYGVYHALETLSQLIVYNFFNHSYQITNAPVNIVDYPRFAHRGILVDSSRHFQPVASLLSIIDSLTYAKMNILHWHIVDSQSFPFESISYPDLWDGSYTPMERYTQEDVAQVIEYGRQRGVRVMLEFDMPGHAASWCVGYPEVCPSPTCTQPLNPATNATFDLVTSLLGEITGGKTGAGLVPENLLHLGGDEVDTSCWNSTASIVDWMNQNNFDADDAYMYFVNRAHQIAIDQGRIPVNWQEVFDHFGSKLDKRSIIHIWDNRQSLARVVAAGYRAILSDADVWYLDHLNIPWELFYTNEPYINITDPTQQQLIIGGEVCMWGETVDVSDVMETIWPRAAAAAERLWSDISVNQTAEFYPRLASFRCTLNNRGIAAAPTSNADARTNPPNPGSCYFQ